jgi:hypothetical protein
MTSNGDLRGREEFDVPDLVFGVCMAKPAGDSACPAVGLEMEVRNRVSGEFVQAVLVRCQVQIETPRRSYSGGEEGKLRDLFGERARWGQTMRPMLWANVAATIPSFENSTIFTIEVPCTFDFNVAATKYFHALEGGTVPVTLMFSGTVFYRVDQQLQAAPISWDTECRFPMPVQVWKETLEMQCPNSAFVCLRRDVFERLYQFKIDQGVATFDEAVERMLESARQECA